MRKQAWLPFVFSILSILINHGIGPASAAELAGVQLPNEIRVQNKPLTLNGLGLRRATVFKVKVYVAGLYVEAKKQNPEAILASKEIKRMVLHFVRDVSADKIRGAWKESFEQNCGTHCEALAGQLQTLNAAMVPFKESDELTLTFFPDHVEVLTADKKETQISGGDFSKILLATWLGAHPPNEDLKAGLLGQKND